MQYAKPVTLNVEECDRLSFLPYLFGNDFLYAEAYVYALAQKMMPEYQGGFWHFIRLTDYIGYDILLQYIQELIQQARAMVATGNYDEAVIGHINDNMNDATRQIAAFQSQVQVQQDALLVVDRQMSYMRQQLSARMLSRYQNNYHFGGSTL
ncbi:hypothetical protein [Escherichia coli]|uniref:hypothetical protein n=1 Tax=Escherichia coli TaxID=562 RepID=UPI000CF014BF|nr:hypothetical protein C5P40_22715 [Escherichia coli]SQO73833.1 fusion of conjugal transfer pilus assembly proteins TraB and TraH [Escherichia coli]SQO76106.1 fusion of conjugal transfer pilus assembly proteins TraB and TraH [Escherichia coli]